MLLDDGALLHLEDPLGAEDEQSRGVTIPTLNPAPDSDFNSFWDLWRFRFRIWIQENVDL